MSIAFQYRDAMTNRPGNFGSIKAITVTHEWTFRSHVKRHGKAVERNRLGVGEGGGIHG